MGPRGRSELAILTLFEPLVEQPLVPHLRRGTHVGRKGIRTMRAERIRIASRGLSPVIADTTDLGRGTVELHVVPNALDIVRRAA